MATSAKSVKTSINSPRRNWLVDEGNNSPLTSTESSTQAASSQQERNINPESKQPLTIFEQARQHVGWQYNAGRDINITNVHSQAELADELQKIRQEVAAAQRHNVISSQAALDLQSQLAQIIGQMRSEQPQPYMIQKQLDTTRDYLRDESVRMAQQMPKQSSNLFTFLIGIATLVAISFDLGITAAIVTGLFGVATSRLQRQAATQRPEIRTQRRFNEASGRPRQK